jgi:hypothetical protein
MSSESPEKKSVSGLRGALLKYGEFNVKLFRGVGKAVQNPKLWEGMRGIGASTEYMATGKLPQQQEQNRTSRPPRRDQPRPVEYYPPDRPSYYTRPEATRKDIHVHIHLDKDDD